MKSKITKIVLTSVLGAAILYAYESWQAYQVRQSFEIGEIQLSQTKIDIKSLQTSFKTPVWSVKTDSPLVCFSINFKNEGSRNFKNTPGLLDIVVSTLLEGAGEYDDIALKKLLKENSIGIAILPNQDNLQVNVTCLAKYFDLTINVLCDILSKAHLTQEKIETAKQGCIASIRQAMFAPDHLALEKLGCLIYPEGHPYRMSFKDMLEKIPTYTREDVARCYSAIFSPQNAEVSIVSNLDENDIKTGLNKVYKAVENRKNDFKKVEEQQTEFSRSGKSEHVELDNPQSTVVFALPVVQITLRQRFALRVANEIFGEVGTLNSRLSRSIREQGEMVYYIKTTFESGDMQSYILGRCNTQSCKVEETMSQIKEEVKKLYENGITQEELTKFKLSKFAKSIFTNSGVILEFVETARRDEVPIENVNSYLDNYSNLTLEEVNAVIKDVYNPERLVFVACGKSLKK
ncbi:MAG: insulinase family protein [Holosporales bacterium]|jgi:zinc protease|nr:insulinase family protein [Holosporales bacterium]